VSVPNAPQQVREGGSFAPSAARLRSAPPPARTKATFRQVAAALLAAHEEGRAHGAVTASNVRVRSDGRVELLGGDEARATSPSERERAFAADWYAFGAMLYEALTGRTPFAERGSEADVSPQAPTPPSAVARGIPRELESLCLDLLAADPRRRPTGADVLRRLGTRSEPPAAAARLGREQPFFGRRAELELLGGELARVVADRAPRLAFVYGEPAIGKSTLVDQFAIEVRTRTTDALVMYGRSYRSESLPYKAFDGIVDALASAIQAMPRVEAERVTPRDASLLLRLFPVLGRIETFRSAPSPPDTPNDPRTRRRRAFGAMRELLARIGARIPLVLIVDDVQDCDADEAELLRSIVSPPEPPVALVVLVSNAAPFARNASNALDARWPTPDRTLEIGPLDSVAGRELEDFLVGEHGASQHATTPGHQTSDHAAQLAVLRCRVAIEGAGGAAALNRAITLAVDALPSQTRRVLELIAIAGAPVSPRTAAHAEKMPLTEVGGVLASLRDMKLVRSDRTGSVELVTCIHERVREVVSAMLGDEHARARHAALAGALAEDDARDPAALAHHYAAAGDLARALPRWSRAATRAAEMLAFDRAATLTRRILEHDPSLTRPQRKALHLDLATAFVGVGRGREAAAAYLAAVEHANSAERIEIQRLAATVLLRSGQIDDGLALLTNLLATVGLSMPRGGLAGLVNVGWNRLRLRMRGYDYVVREENQLPERTLMMLDALAATAHSTGFLLGIGGVALQTRHLRAALAAGEPRRIARALFSEIGYLAVYGTPAAAQADRAIAAASAVIERIGDPALGATLAGITALSTYNRGKFVEALEQIEHAVSDLRRRKTGANYQEDIVFLESWRLPTLLWLGRVREILSTRAAMLRDAQDCGDLWSASLTQLYTGEHARLWAEDLAAMNAAQDEAILTWKAHAFGYPHFLHMTNLANRALAEGRGADAVAILSAADKDVRRAMLLGAQMLRVLYMYTWGRALLATGDRSKLGRVLRLAQRLAREGVPYAVANGSMLRAAVAFLRKDYAAALRELEAVEAIHSQGGSACVLVQVRMFQARVLGGEAGAKLAAETAVEMTRLGIRRPELIFPLLGLRQGD
jgi:eukaryotic-like serine/threonine-protein kinase